MNITISAVVAGETVSHSGEDLAAATAFTTSIDPEAIESISVHALRTTASGEGRTFTRSAPDPERAKHDLADLLAWLGEAAADA